MIIETITAISCVGCGVAIGMYISSQIKRHVDRNIRGNNDKKLVDNIDRMNSTKTNWQDEVIEDKNGKWKGGNISHNYTYIKKGIDDN